MNQYDRSGDRDQPRLHRPTHIARNNWTRVGKELVPEHRFIASHRHDDLYAAVMNNFEGANSAGGNAKSVGKRPELIVELRARLARLHECTQP